MIRAMGQIVDVIEGQTFPRSEEVGCPICGRHFESRRIPVRYAMFAMVAECADCRIAFQSPRPSVEASLAYMNWRWRSADAYVADPERQMKRARKQVAHVRKHLKRSGTRKPIRLADFGAGAGSFVRAALDHGWQATGIEQSDSAIARAREFYGVELRKDWAGDRYDVVTMWDVIEHLRDLEGTLRMIGEHLVDGGLLFIETGNFESWRRLAEADAWSLYLLDHQFYFTPNSLNQVLHITGYGDFCLLRVGRSWPNPKGLLRNPIRAARSWMAWARAKTRWPRHGDINVMVAVAKKNAV
jgi:SAM-dependent methyltransferase